MTSPFDIFEMLQDDETAKMMLEKRKITDAEKLENFMYKY